MGRARACARCVSTSLVVFKELRCLMVRDQCVGMSIGVDDKGMSTGTMVDGCQTVVQT